MLGHSSTILDLPCLLIISFSQCLVSGTAAVYEIWLYARFWIYLHCSSVDMSCFRVNIFTSFCLLWQRTKYCIYTMKNEIEQIYFALYHIVKIKMLFLNLTSLINWLTIRKLTSSQWDFWHKFQLSYLFKLWWFC